MKAKIQLELFAENDELTLMRKELNELYHQYEKLKRTLYSRHNELAKWCLKLEKENEDLKRRLDKMEKASQKEGKELGDDLLEKLFREAYLPQSPS
jgi:regulator of replication initiation timing